MTIFWIGLAVLYFVLAVFTFRSWRSILKDLGGDHPVGTAFIRDGKVIAAEQVLYNHLRNMFVIDILGFVFAAAAAVATFIMELPS